MNLIEAYANLDSESKKTQKRLDEKIPRDLANAMKNPRGGENTSANAINTRRRGYNQYNNYPDFENNEYTEITPEEAINLKKQGQAGKVKALVNGEFVDFYNDGSTNSRSSYVRNNYGTLVKNADKLYFVDDSKANAKEKRAQRDKDNSLTYYAGSGWSDEQPRAVHASVIGDTGRHEKLPSWVASEEKKVQNYTQELSELEKAWEDGDVSRNEYNRRKEHLQGEIEYYKKSVKQGKEKYGNNEYEHRYDADAKRMQSKLNRYRDIKERPAEKDVNRRKAEVAQAEQNYQEKIAQKEKEIAKLQQQVDKLKSDRNNDWQYEWANDNLKKAEANLARQKKDLADMKSGKWSVDDLKTESLKRKNKLTESYNDNAFNMVSDSVDSIIDEVREGGDLEDAIRDEIDSHMLIYYDDIVDLSRYYDVIDYSKLSDDVYEPLFEDLYSRVKDKLDS